FGLWARATPSLRHLREGMELADSWATDAHKWLNTPYDGAFAIVRDAAAHARAMSATASYLPAPEGERDPSHFVPELSRRARGTAIFATIRALGRAGIAEAVERCCANARLMRDLLTETPGVACLNDVVLNQAAFRFAAPNGDASADALTKEVVRKAVETGEVFLQTAEWRGRTIMRCSVTSQATTEDDIRRVAEVVLDAYKRSVN
ncbi:MAG: pyridoxal-dependent decarboxylase, partial [Pseudomonadota bacterium]